MATAYATSMRALSRQPLAALRPRAPRQSLARRLQSTAAAGAAQTQSGFRRLMDSPVGPKTVHFWAPIMKWGLVVAGIGDMMRPAENVSLQQNLALIATGLIWTRWCFVIRPQNYFLATVNFFVFITGGIQVTRVLRYRASLNSDGVADEAAKEAQAEGALAKGIAENPKSAVRTAEQKV